MFRPVKDTPAPAGCVSWTVDRVAEWLKQIQLAEYEAAFRKEKISGKALIELTESDLKELQISMGDRKVFLKEREALIAQQAIAAKAGKAFKLPKGFLPIGHPFTDQGLDRIRLSHFDWKSKSWVPRDVPLVPEELECWVEQAKWLVCPITGKRWHDKGTVLGVAIYHAPRFLSKKEQARALEEENAATVQNKQKKLNSSQEGVNNTPAPAATSTAGHAGLTRSGEDRGVEWARDFEVYPRVVPPPAENIEPLGPLPEDVGLGSMQVIIGPAFDITAFNQGCDGVPDQGILSQPERGIRSMDQQYNALNFVYHIQRAANSYELKICTNRLSFFIDEIHGHRVFPENIESQLSLLVFRTANRLKDDNGKTDQQLLAKVITRVIPRVLRAVVIEVVHGEPGAISERLDHAIRTYLLVHQTCIKLIIYYRQAYETLYRSVINWIQNPFNDYNTRAWPNVEELLLGASLVGVPWSVLREAFVRKFLVELINNAPKLRPGAPFRQKLKHWFIHNNAFIRCILYELSFFLASKPLLEQDRVYTRCAGSLPRKERENMKAMVMAVQQVDTLEKVWLMLGMDPPGQDAELVLQHIEQYVSFIETNLAAWKLGHQQAANQHEIRVPALESMSSVASLGILQYNTEIEKQAQRAEAEERRKHQGYPVLQGKEKLPANKCLYPECGKVFKCRDHLFRHLNRMIEPERMIRGYHQKHFKLNPQPDALVCGACGKTANSKEEISRHYADMGVPGFKKGKGQDDEIKKVEREERLKNVDQYSDADLCCICLDAKRSTVNIPCGHLVCCKTCGVLQKQCPICRAPIKDVIMVFYA